MATAHRGDRKWSPMKASSRRPFSLAATSGARVPADERGVQEPSAERPQWLP